MCQRAGGSMRRWIHAYTVFAGAPKRSAISSAPTGSSSLPSQSVSLLSCFRCVSGNLHCLSHTRGLVCRVRDYFVFWSSSFVGALLGFRLKSLADPLPRSPTR